MKLLLLSALMSVLAFGNTQVDLKKSQFKWTGTKVTGKHYGKIFLKDAKITEKKGKLTAGEFVMDMNTITVDDLSGEWQQKLVDHLLADDFFNTKKYPTATLKIKKVKKDKIKADLTIKGKTHPVEFSYTKKDKAYTGILKFDRTKFDMTYKSANFFKQIGDKAIHDEVVLEFTAYTK